MPATKKIGRKKILAAGIDLIREMGEGGFNARNLSVKLNCSTQPLYSEFKNMEELKDALFEACYRVYEEFVSREVASGKYPSYKAYGIAYFCFAREERELFRFLFLRSRKGEESQWEKDSLKPVVEGIVAATGLSYDSAMTLHAEMWSLVHGFATQTATGYLNWEVSAVSELMTVAYRGVKNELCRKER